MGVTFHALPFVLCSALTLVEAKSIGTRLTLFREPSSSHVRRYLERQDSDEAPTNHPFAGFTDPLAVNSDQVCPPCPPPGFQPRTVRVRLGSGKATYKRGSDALLQWRMHDGSSWARIVLGRRRLQMNSQLNMVTVAKACAGMAWCINPCQVLYERTDIPVKFLAPPGTTADPPHPPAFRRNMPWHSKETPTCADDDGGRLWDGGAPRSAPRWASFLNGDRCEGRQSAVAYATKQGHLIQGEERMRVVWFSGRGGDDSVWFEVFSVSRGAGFVGGAVFPFVRSMQSRFFREQAETMRRICQPPHVT